MMLSTLTPIQLLAPLFAALIAAPAPLPTDLPDELSSIPRPWLRSYWQQTHENAAFLVVAYDLNEAILPAYWHDYYTLLADMYSYEKVFFDEIRKLEPDEMLKRSRAYTTENPMSDEKLMAMVESLLDPADFSLPPPTLSRTQGTPQSGHLGCAGRDDPHQEPPPLVPQRPAHPSRPPDRGRPPHALLGLYQSTQPGDPRRDSIPSRPKGRQARHATSIQPHSRRRGLPPASGDDQATPGSGRFHRPPAGLGRSGDKTDRAGYRRDASCVAIGR